MFEQIPLLIKVFAAENGPTERRMVRIIRPMALMGSLLEFWASQCPYPWDNI